jgi:hypothetical protein
MTRYLSHRERKLLRWNELSVRGCSLQYSGMVDEEEDQYREHATETSDEDYLLSKIFPTPLLDLPQILAISNTSSPCMLRYECYKQQQLSNCAESLRVLRESVFTNPKYTRYSRRLDLSTTEFDHDAIKLGGLDPDIFLDYLPLLRCMAVQERISEIIYKTQDTSSDDCRSTSRRRNTRLSKRLGREQYFDKIIQLYTWQESNPSSKDVADHLANMSMLYKSNKTCFH